MDAMSFLPPRLDRTRTAELAASMGRRPEVLTWGEGRDVVVVAMRDSLALRRDGAWETWGWQEILSGSWRADADTFRWVCADGRRVEAHLDSPARLPEVFRERVQASTVMTETHDLERGSVAIIGRRSLDGTDSITWYATASGGADLAEPATSRFVVRRTDELKAEWD